MSTRPTQVGTAVTGTSSGGLTITLGTPTTLATGDLLVVAFMANDIGTQGFFEVDTAHGGAKDTTWTQQATAISAGANVHMALWTRTWTSGDATSWDYYDNNSGGAAYVVVVVSAWRGTKAATFFDGSVSISATDSGGTTIVSTAKTPSDANDVLMIAYADAASGATNPTLPTGLTQIGFATGGSIQARFCYKNLSSTSSTGTFSSTPSFGVTQQGVFTVLLAAKPAAAVILPFQDYYQPIVTQ